MGTNDELECFRIDESGYTGFDLMNPEQRFQGAAAVAITDTEAASLIREHFPKLQAAELKYRALARRPANHRPLIEILRAVLSRHKCITYVCDKRYLLCLMFMDYAVEPYYYERGLNFYEDGQNYALGSLLYTIGPSVFGANFENLLGAFQCAMKEKTQDSLRALVFAAQRLKWRELPEALGPLAQAAPECLLAIATPGVTTDAAMVVLQSLITRMEAVADDPYRVEHDQSKNLLTYHDLLQRYINHRDDVEFRQSPIASIKFPLKLTAVTQVDSKSSPAVQIADILIGSMMEATNGLTGIRAPALDPNEVLALYAHDQLIHMLPSTNFAEQKAFRKGTQASLLIDYFATHFHKQP